MTFPFKIGSIEIRNPVFLAPMSGITDAPFRSIAWRHGAGLVVTEMVASEALTHGKLEFLQKSQKADEGPHVVQLAGREARWMRLAAEIATGSGADIIDINMGCPARKVTNGASGSALMRDLDHAERLIEATLEGTNCPVTLKMRLGWDDTTINAPELAKRAQAAGVEMITVHGRTRSQFYKGNADWNAVRSVREVIDIPLVVNGDITTFDDATKALAASGADAIMIGRGAYGRPWLPGAIAKFLETGARSSMPSYHQIHVDLNELYDGMLSLYGTRIGTRAARKHLAWTFDVLCPISGTSGKSQRPQLLTDILTGEDPAKILQDINFFFEGLSSLGENAGIGEKPGIEETAAA